jgi:NADPH:quinone reductase-like Zn-dependent oxidoreductase
VGPPEVLVVKEAPDPEPADGQVRVRVRASGINFADLSARQGLYPDAPKIPCVVGYEVSGVVDRVGGSVSGIAEGDRVFAMPHFGGYSDTVVLPAAQTFHMPQAMTFEEGAALPVVYLTAHHMLLFTGALRPGMRVLVHSAAGGVGLAAIQLLRAHRCEILGVASTSKHEFLRSEGCAHAFDSALPPAELAGAVRAVVGERGVDVVLDPVGGRSFNESYKLLGPAGRLVCFGFSSATGGKERSLVRVVRQFLAVRRYHPITLMNDNKSVSGVNMGHLFSRLDLLRPQFESLVAMYERGEIRPHVDRTFPFAEAPAAHHYLHDRKAKGKVLLTP